MRLAQPIISRGDAFVAAKPADKGNGASAPAALPKLPNIGRMKTGCGVGNGLALGSPICDQAMMPPLMTISGFAPKNAGFHKTRSASLPVSTEPMHVRHAVRRWRD